MSRRAVLAAALLVSCRSALFHDFAPLYAAREQSAMNRDSRALIEQTTPDYLFRWHDGTVATRDQMVARWSFYTANVLGQQLRFRNVIRSVEPRGDDVVVTYVQCHRRLDLGPAGYPMEVETNVIYRDTWTRTAAGWKLHLTEEGKPIKTTVDGVSRAPEDARLLFD